MMIGLRVCFRSAPWPQLPMNQVLANVVMSSSCLLRPVYAAGASCRFNDRCHNHDDVSKSPCHTVKVAV